jgi:hypothetical protein
MLPRPNSTAVASGPYRELYLLSGGLAHHPPSLRLACSLALPWHE